MISIGPLLDVPPRAAHRQPLSQIQPGSHAAISCAPRIIATTAPPDTALDRIARDLTENFGFRVAIYGWAELVGRLQDHPEDFENWRRKPAGDPTHPFHRPFRPLGELLKGREAELVRLALGLKGSASGAFAVTQQRLEAVHGLRGVASPT